MEYGVRLERAALHALLRADVGHYRNHAVDRSSSAEQRAPQRLHVTRGQRVAVGVRQSGGRERQCYVGCAHAGCSGLTTMVDAITPASSSFSELPVAGSWGSGGQARGGS